MPDPPDLMFFPALEVARIIITGSESDLFLHIRPASCLVLAGMSGCGQTDPFRKASRCARIFGPVPTNRFRSGSVAGSGPVPAFLLGTQTSVAGNTKTWVYGKQGLPETQKHGFMGNKGGRKHINMGLWETNKGCRKHTKSHRSTQTRPNKQEAINPGQPGRTQRRYFQIVRLKVVHVIVMDMLSPHSCLPVVWKFRVCQSYGT